MVSRRAVGALLGGLWLAGCLIGIATAADTDLSKTAGGVTVYLGIVPAEIVKGLPSGSTTVHARSCHESQLPSCASAGKSSTRPSSTSSNARARLVLFV